MRSRTLRTLTIVLLSAASVTGGLAATKHKTATKASTAKAASMDTTRATQIQTALIKQGYLSGEPTGKWDAESISAMQKLQSDNGWQTKIVPDSRALIKLGLGPNAAAPQQAETGTSGGQ